jgi:hypothetical protein
MERFQEPLRSTMQIPFKVEFADGSKTDVLCGTPDFIAFEEKYNLAISVIQKDPRLTYLSFIVWNALRRIKKTEKSFEDFVETLVSIEADDDADPKAL